MLLMKVEICSLLFVCWGGGGGGGGGGQGDSLTFFFFCTVPFSFVQGTLTYFRSSLLSAQTVTSGSLSRQRISVM